MRRDRQTRSGHGRLRQTVALALIRASAFVFGGALLVASNLHWSTFRGAELDAVMSLHWPLVLTAFFGGIGFSLLFAMLGHRAQFEGYDYVQGGSARYSYDSSILGWPKWVTIVVRIAAVYAVLAFAWFFLEGESVVEVGGQYFVYPENGGAKVPISTEEYASIAVEKQRGVTAMYVPVFLALMATSLFARTADELAEEGR